MNSASSVRYTLLQVAEVARTARIDCEVTIATVTNHMLSLVLHSARASLHGHLEAGCDGLVALGLRIRDAGSMTEG